MSAQAEVAGTWTACQRTGLTPMAISRLERRKIFMLQARLKTVRDLVNALDVAGARNLI